MKTFNKLNINMNDIFCEDSICRDLLTKLPTNEASGLITVGKSGCMFTDLTEAINYAKSIATKENRVTILIYPGVYRTQINLLDNQGIDMCGLDSDTTTIVFNGDYPNCVIYTTGTGTFTNLHFSNDNHSTYALHFEAGGSNVTGTTIFKNCIFSGGTGAGVGLNHDCNVQFENCRFIGVNSSNGIGLYAHNSAYSNNQNQLLSVINCSVYGQAYDVLIDDACTSNGGTNSIMIVNFSGTYSTHNNSFRFRFNTNTGDSYTCIPINSPNVQLTSSSVGTSLLGLDYANRYMYISAYLNASQYDNNGYYYFYVPFNHANYYGAVLNNVTLSVSGEDLTSEFEMVTNDTGIILSTRRNISGRTIAITISGYPKN